MADSYRGFDFARRSVAYSARPIRRRAGNDVPCSVWMSDRQGRDAAQGEGAPQYFLDGTGEDIEALARIANERPSGVAEHKTFDWGLSIRL